MISADPSRLLRRAAWAGAGLVTAGALALVGLISGVASSAADTPNGTSAPATGSGPPGDTTSGQTGDTTGDSGSAQTGGFPGRGQFPGSGSGGTDGGLQPGDDQRPAGGSNGS